MASYKQPCIHCGAYINPDLYICSTCQSRSPFGYLCPTCLYPIQKEQSICPNCSRSLYVSCLVCKNNTFVQEKCTQCGESLMINCQNPRCGALQFFENTKCTACGKKIKLIKK